MIHALYIVCRRTDDEGFQVQRAVRLPGEGLYRGTKPKRATDRDEVGCLGRVVTQS